MSERKAAYGECVYCGQSSELTVDHVPPQCMLGERLGDVVEVPSCRECNQSFSLDDEYLKTMSVRKDRAGKGAADRVDLARMGRVVSRVTRALFWHHQGRRLPSVLRVAVFSEAALRDLGSDGLKQAELRSIGGDALRYSYAMAQDSTDGSAWMLEFYGDVRFLAFTVPRRFGEGRAN